MSGNSIIWDWNGTLLNDLGLCVSSINILLGKRSLPLLNNQSYKDVFSFPVKNYYQSVGFNFEAEEFEVPAREFIDLYEAGVKSCRLHNEAVNILSKFKEKGFHQFVLSAMHQEMLENTLKYNGIFHFFEGIAGLDNHLAVSKLERGKQLIRQFKIKTEDTYMIGDTVHDFEVAHALGIGCILIANGHQSTERLKSTGTCVVEELYDLLSLI